MRSTLKITSAMKLVASSKLLKAQRAIDALRPYEQALSRIVSSLPAGGTAESEAREGLPTVLLAFSGNTSMCGAFNSNVIKLTLRTLRSCEGPVQVWAFGRKMADALRKNGTPAVRDFSSLAGSPSSAEAAGISAELRSLYGEGRIGRVLLVYNHFVSTGRQEPRVEAFLPYSAPVCEGGSAPADDLYYIYEPSAEALARSLVPQVLDLRLYAALLDSAAAEHAARMVAMQAATDNGEELLSELTLEYNKGRQQKITSEILDLIGGETQS